jgi:hypothetical protein
LTDEEYEALYTAAFWNDTTVFDINGKFTSSFPKNNLIVGSLGTTLKDGA